MDELQKLTVADFIRSQPCPNCKTPMGDMPGTRDAHCSSCGFKDPCCGD